MKIGIESCYGFGDCLMNAGVIHKIFQCVEGTVDVAVGECHKDAFYNIPNVNIIPLKGFRPLGKGMEYFENNDYDLSFQMTQHASWNPHQSFGLWATPHRHAVNICASLTYSGLLDPAKSREMSLQFWSKETATPLFIPTEKEISNVASFVSLRLRGKPLVAIETGFSSNQSWLTPSTARILYDHYSDSHEVLFVSKDNGFSKKLDGLTRRECIVLLSYCEKFFNTCSGFFVASMSDPIKFPKLENICMINKNDFERFKFQHLKSNPNITIAFNKLELIEFLEKDLI